MPALNDFEHRPGGFALFGKGIAPGAARRPPKTSWLLGIRSSRSLIVYRAFTKKC